MSAPSQEQLRGFTRKQIQSLAKSENIKPANASTETLIQRLLEKFSAPDWSPQLSSCTRRSSRLAKVETFEIDLSCHAVDRSPPRSRASITLKSSRAKAAPYPTRQHVGSIQNQLHGVLTDIAKSPPTFHTMDLVLPRLERTAAHSQQQLSMFAWQGHYLEHVVVGSMKEEPQLWDGTNVMQPPLRREKWLNFLKRCAQKTQESRSRQN